MGSRSLTAFLSDFIDQQIERVVLIYVTRNIISGLTDTFHR